MDNAQGVLFTDDGLRPSWGRRGAGVLLTFENSRVCMVSSFQQSMDQPGMVANPARGRLLNRENVFSMSPFAPESLVSRTGSAVPSRVSPLMVFTRGLLCFPPLSATASQPYRQPPSSQSRVNRVTQLRTDGVPCREPAGTGPVVLKVVRVTGAALVLAAFSGVMSLWTQFL